MMKARLELPETHCQALRILLEQVPPLEVTWMLTGSGGLRLQGVDIPVHDLDIQGDVAAMDEIARCIPYAVQVKPAWRESPQIRSHYGKLKLCGLKVELMGNIQHFLTDGSWSQVVDSSTWCRWVTWQGYQVPVIDLAYEAQAYEELGRFEKACLIRAVLEKSL